MAKSFVDRYKELGVKFVSETGGNAVGHCPLHHDERSSFSVNVENGLWKCFVATCPGFKGGNFAQFYRLRTGNAYEEPREIPDQEVQELHEALLKNHAVLKWLEELRGITSDTVKTRRLGWDGDRICIPIFERGKCVNVRRHSPKKGVQAKTLHYKTGWGSLKLYPEETLAADKILLCEGELDAILACQLGFSALTVTGGAGSWNKQWNQLFKDKEVYLCYDIDNAGRHGAKVIAENLLGSRSKPRLVKNILLPITSPPNGDLTDYIVVHGYGAADLSALLENSPEVRDAMDVVVEEAAPVEVELAEASEGKNIGRVVKLKATVAGKDLSPYACPKDVKFTCGMGLRICSLCSIGQANGTLKYTVPNNSIEVIRLIDCSEDKQRGHLRKSAGVYPNCPRFKMDLETFYPVEDVRLIPEVSFNSQANAEYVVRTGFHVGHGLKPNTTYELEGLVAPNPQNQHITFILPKAKPVKDSVAGFQLTPDLMNDLKIFQPTHEETVKQKLWDIAHDLVSNVTHIYNREQLVQVIDLVYHSVLAFKFMGRIVKKGWTEGLILGDTRCGKTETVTQLIEHYKAGEMSTGENASFAGLVGGMQAHGDRWAIIWGKLPLNDRRLFVIDEVSGMSEEDVGRMSGVRSSGIAEIIKVQTEKTFARTRLLWIGNPRSPRPLSSYDTGVQAIKELIGRPEDIARFDLAVTVATGEVPIEIINQKEPPKVRHQYTSDLCHALVLWAWSRTVDQVKFTKEAEEACLHLASQMGKQYSSQIPLVEASEQRIKLARLSVAAAARLFSTKDGNSVLVTADHVKLVHDLLQELYASPSMNYLAFSKVKIAEMTLKNEAEVKQLVEGYGPNFIEGLLDHPYIRLGDIEDMLNLEKKEVKPIVAKLVQSRALKHYHTSYVKTPAFIEFLRKAQASTAGQKVEEF